MKYYSVAILFLFFLLLFSSNVLAWTEWRNCERDADGQVLGHYSSGSFYLIATNFTFNETKNIINASAYVSSVYQGAPSNLVGQLRPDNAGKPSSTILLEGTMISTTAAAWNTVVFNASYTIPVNTTYWIVWTTALKASEPATNDYQMGKLTAGCAPYADDQDISVVYNPNTWGSTFVAGDHSLRIGVAESGANTTDAYIFLRDFYNSSTINTFNITIYWPNGTQTLHSTTNGTVSLINITNDTATVNISAYGITGYYNTSLTGAVFTNATTTNHYLYSTRIYQVFNKTFSNYVTSGTVNYTRNLTYSVNLSCPSFDVTKLNVNVGNATVYTHNVTCTNSSQAVTGSYQADTEGNTNISFYYNATSYTETVAAQNFTYDLYAPTAAINFSVNEGFNNHATNVTLVCTDNIYPTLFYNNTLNGVVLYTGNLSNASVKINASTLVYGVNSAYGFCADAFSNDTDTYNRTVYAATLALIDERNNTAFDVSNISGARVYYDDNSTYYDFKTAGNVSSVNFTSILTNKLRFELIYATGDVIIRYVDVSLLADPVRVCANREGVTHYEQLLISAIEKPVVVKNVFSNCVIAADYTRFAYQSSLVLKAYSINSLYYLYTFEGTDQVLLASIDGSISTYINLDTLEFNQNAYDVTVLGDALAFEKTSSTQMKIYYRNLADDNANLTATITKLDNTSSSVVFTTSSFTNPNNFTMYFDFTTLNITNETVFKITLTKTSTSGITSTISKYFNTQAKSGQLASGVGFAIAFLLIIFGLTFTIARTTFSWFGIVVTIASIGVLTFTMAAWYITFLMVIDVIILLYICIVLAYQNYPTVS